MVRESDRPSPEEIRAYWAARGRDRFVWFVAFFILGASVLASFGFYRQGATGFQPFGWWLIPAGVAGAAAVIIANWRLARKAKTR